DDLRVTLEPDPTTGGERIAKLEPHCPLAEERLPLQLTARPALAEIDGQPVTLDAALDRAAEILRNSQIPLVYGLSRSSTPGQRAATHLADHLGATIDTTASLCHAQSIMAVQAVGESTASLGEIRHRADLVIFWGSNPVVSHPRHLERYSRHPSAMFLPGDASQRTLVVVDIEATKTREQADVFVQIKPGHDFAALWTLRALIQGIEPTAGAETGANLDELRSLAQRMRECKCGVVFFGLGLTQPPVGHANVEALLRLVTDLNAITRFHAKRMRIYGDVAGADAVLCWQTGYPFSVNLARGYPRYYPGEYTANDLLERGEVDSCLLVGSESTAPPQYGTPALSDRALARLRAIPTIALDYPYSPGRATLPASVRITTAVYGIHRAGTAYRMDEVPIPLRAFAASAYPSDDEVLAQLTTRLGFP
ncbi:MAG: formylmethanofuran dehydrogenase subunit B, partial [Planctomycetaceae bacterium]|nr:formylmethanofuran dehydrogenase subunit B [Planctomycetaceae bacterium]